MNSRQECKAADEALRRLEIPEDLQKRYGLKPLGPADGPIKRAIFGENNARLYNFTPAQRAAVSADKIASGKAIYDRHGDGRTNMAYGYVNRGVAWRLNNSGPLFHLRLEVSRGIAYES